MKRRRIETFRDTDGNLRFRIIADNGEIIAQSEAYQRRHDMNNTMIEYFPEWIIIPSDD